MKSFLFFLVCLISFGSLIPVHGDRASGESLIWASDSQDAENEFKGILQYDLQRKQFSALINLTNVSDEQLQINAFALDSGDDFAYLFMGNGTFGYVVKANLDTQDISIFPGGFALMETDAVVDMQWDSTSSSIYVLVSHLESFEIFAFTPENSQFSSIIQLNTGYGYYFGSDYDVAKNRFFFLFANGTGSYYMIIDLNAPSFQTAIAPYNLVGIAYESNTNSLIGNSQQGGYNLLTVFSLTHLNITVIGTPFSGLVCGGSINRAVIDYNVGVYYTVCCYDQAGCTNATLAGISLVNNEIVTVEPISVIQQVSEGFYLAPPQKRKL